MIIAHNLETLQKALFEIAQAGKTIALVPTMGALHAGHASLISQAKEFADVAVVSIFVNPTQFNDKSDLERYPRDLQKDVDLLGQTPCKLVFAPEVNEVYPEPDTRQFNFGTLEQVMEGKFRVGGIFLMECEFV